MSPAYREVTGEDKAYCLEHFPKLQTHLNYSPKWFHHWINLDKAIEFLFEQNSGNTFIVEEKFLVSYVVAEQWNLDGRHLFELCIVDLYRDQPGDWKSCLRFLEQMALIEMADCVHVGTSLRDSDIQMAGELADAGYQPANFHHFREVPRP